MLCFFALLVLMQVTLAQNIIWQKVTGGFQDDNLVKSINTSDGGILSAGNSFSGISGNKTTANYDPLNNTTDIWVVKLNATGSIEWQRSYGGTYWDFIADIKQTSDKGFIIGAYSSSGISGNKTENNIGAYDYWIIKTDSTGIIEWQNTIGGFGFDQLTSIIQTADNGYLAGGYSQSGTGADKIENSINNSLDYWVVKLDSTGNISWQNTIGGVITDELLSVVQTKDGGYLLAGWSDSNISGDKTLGVFGNADYWLLKINSTGNILWQKVFGGNKYDECNTVKITPDNEILLSGYSNSDSSGNKFSHTHDSIPVAGDYWIILLDSVGNKLWEQAYGGAIGDVCWGSLVENSNSFNFYGTSLSGISGNKTDSCRGQLDYWFISTDNAGNITNQQSIGGFGQDEMYGLCSVNFGQIILSGTSSSPASGEKTINCFNNSNDYWILKLDKTLSGWNEHYESHESLTLFPNPCSSILHWKLSTSKKGKIKNVELYDVAGRLIIEENTQEQILKTGKLKDGIYLIKINYADETFVSRFVVQH